MKETSSSSYFSNVQNKVRLQIDKNHFKYNKMAADVNDHVKMNVNLPVIVKTFQ